MPGSRPALTVDFLTESHRVSCRVTVGSTGLFAQLNDINTSIVEAEDAYLSRLQQPAKIGLHFDFAYLRKATIVLVVLSRREDLDPQGLARSGYARVATYPVLVTAAQFEIQGTLELAGKFEPGELLVGGTARYVLLYNATAVATPYPDLPYSGGVILVNRSMVGLISPIPKAKS